MARLRFPEPAALAVTAGGLFVLALTTAAGEAEAQVFFLQGEAGQCSNTLTGDVTINGTLTVTGQSTLAGATVQSFEVTGSYELPPCPPGYEEDLSAFPSYPEIHVCVHPTSGDEMVKVGDLWIDRYEATVYENTDCTGARYGETSDDYPSGFPDNGNWSGVLYACSVPGVIPSSNLTWFQAQASCAAAGKHLCSNAEWQSAVEGTFDPDTAYDGLSGPGCNTAAGGDGTGGPRATGLAGAGLGVQPGAQEGCISRWGAEDLVGNLWELTAQWHQTGMAWQTADGQNSSWPAGYKGDQNRGLNGRTYAGAMGYLDGIPAVPQRGGNFATGAPGGAFTVYWNAGPTSGSWSTGFRCCRGR